MYKLYWWGSNTGIVWLVLRCRPEEYLGSGETLPIPPEYSDGRGSANGCTTLSNASPEKPRVAQQRWQQACTAL